MGVFRSIFSPTTHVKYLAFERSLYFMLTIEFSLLLLYYTIPQEVCPYIQVTFTDGCLFWKGIILLVGYFTAHARQISGQAQLLLLQWIYCFSSLDRCHIFLNMHHFSNPRHYCSFHSSAASSLHNYVRHMVLIQTESDSCGCEICHVAANISVIFSDVISLLCGKYFTNNNSSSKDVDTLSVQSL